MSFFGMGMMKRMEGFMRNGIGYLVKEIWGGNMDVCLISVGIDGMKSCIFDTEGQYGVRTMSEGVKSVYRAKGVYNPSPELTKRGRSA